MNVAGGLGGQCGDLPVFISDIREDSVIGRCEKVQVCVDVCVCVCVCWRG